MNTKGRVLRYVIGILFSMLVKLGQLKRCLEQTRVLTI